VSIVGGTFAAGWVGSKEGFTTPKEVTMRRIQLLVAMVLSAMLLAACHTTAGAGRDISAAGNAITHSATEHSY
jgi:predicted small secreted protein